MDQLTKEQWQQDFNDYCNEPAFPAKEVEKEKTGELHFTGITRLEYFTAEAMQGLIVTPNLVQRSGNREISIPDLSYEFAVATLHKAFALQNGPCPAN